MAVEMTYKLIKVAACDDKMLHTSCVGETVSDPFEDINAVYREVEYMMTKVYNACGKCAVEVMEI